VARVMPSSVILALPGARRVVVIMRLGPVAPVLFQAARD